MPAGRRRSQQDPLPMRPADRSVGVCKTSVRLPSCWDRRHLVGTVCGRGRPRSDMNRSTTKSDLLPKAIPRKAMGAIERIMSERGRLGRTPQNSPPMPAGRRRSQQDPFPNLACERSDGRSQRDAMKLQLSCWDRRHLVGSIPEIFTDAGGAPALRHESWHAQCLSLQSRQLANLSLV